jgi:hypothetical protein
VTERADLRGLLDAQRLPSVRVMTPSGAVDDVARFLRQEERAAEPIDRVAGCWAPNKPALSFGGQVTWAEFVLVRLLEQGGWDARWVKNWTGGREFCVDVGVSRPLPENARDAFLRIDRRAASATGGGAWDIFAWRGDEYLILESKKFRSGDVLRPGQIAWFAAAVLEGFDATQFAIVEYDPGPIPR